jgi:hypothetical protein
VAPESIGGVTPSFVAAADSTTDAPASVVDGVFSIDHGLSSVVDSMFSIDDGPATVASLALR